MFFWYNQHSNLGGINLKAFISIAILGNYLIASSMLTSDAVRGTIPTAAFPLNNLGGD